MTIRKKLTGFAAKFITGRVMLLLLGLMAGAITWATWATWQMEQCQQQIGRCDEVEKIAERNAAATVALGERVSACVNQRALDLQAERAANAQLERDLRIITEQATAERERRNAIYATEPSCEAWRAGAVCQPIGRRLYESAARIEPANNRSADAGAAADSRRARRPADGDE